MDNNKTDASHILAAGAALSENYGRITPESSPFAIVPDGYAIKYLECTLTVPTRKRSAVIVSDEEGFCAYISLHAGEESMIYADIDHEVGRLVLVCVLNDDSQVKPGWRDHTCTLSARQSIEWKRWNENHKVRMNQADFAAWLEENLKDVLSADGMPTGADMLQMALGFERTSDKRLKSKINLQSGGFRFEYVDDEEKDTRTSMQVFDRFAIAVPVFEGSTLAYRVDARLKYRDNDGKLSFWFELIRPDQAFRQAVEDVVSKIAANLNIEIINGKPGK
jgi:uncharacterized protein YfdQ (DUF2303 family)